MTFRSIFCSYISCTLHMFLSLQVQCKVLRSPALQSLPRSRPPLTCWLTNVPSVTRMRWTPSCTPADTCVSATPAASGSRRWPTLAAQSVGGQSKTSSRSTGTHKLVFRQSPASLKFLIKPWKVKKKHKRDPHVCVCIFSSGAPLWNYEMNHQNISGSSLGTVQMNNRRRIF